MAKTALELSPEEWKQFSLPDRPVTPEVKAHWEKAWKLIPKLAKFLREDFGATRIKVFGSAIDVDYFSMESDIDLAAWGISGRQYFLAALAAYEFDETFKVDLVNADYCRSRLLDVIQKEGIDV